MKRRRSAARAARQRPPPEERRENALRPCAALGYDRDRLALYMLEHGLYEMAEAQLRRAVWLNPYEPGFKSHLAYCLHVQNKNEEARDWATKSLEQREAPDTRRLLEIIGRRQEERGDRAESRNNETR